MAKRKPARARGCIREVARAKPFEVRVTLPPDPQHPIKRRLRTATFATRKEAQRTLTAWLGEVDRGEAPTGTPMTLGDLLDAWYAAHAHRWRPTTAVSYATTIRCHVRAHPVARKRIDRLTAGDLEAHYGALARAGTGERTVALVHRRIRQALDWAARDRLVPRNVAAIAEPPAHDYRESRTWDEGQVRTFLTAARADDPYGPVFDVLLLGLRRGEALGLAWDDLDWQRSTLTVRRTAYVSPAGSVAFGPPKTKTSRREVPVPAPVLDLLRTHRARQAERRLEMGPAWPTGIPGVPDLVFRSEVGTPISPGRFAVYMDRVVAAAGVPRLTPHGLRHTAATTALYSGQALPSVSSLLGHAGGDITARTYAHVLSHGTRSASEALGKAFYGGENARSVDAG